MNKLFLIKVPNKSKNHFINKVGCLRYDEMIGNITSSSCIEPEQIGHYLNEDLHDIIGYVELDSSKYIVIKHLNNDND